MDKPLTFKQRELISAKKAALLSALNNNSNPDAASLSRSYGLPVADVEQVIRSYRNGR